MRADSSDRCFTPESLGRLSSAPNSLFRNIITSNAFGLKILRGCTQAVFPGNPLRMNILEKTSKRSAEINTKTGLQADAKSLSARYYL